jgi:hypothetical protein
MSTPRRVHEVILPALETSYEVELPSDARVLGCQVMGQKLRLWVEHSGEVLVRWRFRAFWNETEITDPSLGYVTTYFVNEFTFHLYCARGV